MVHPRIIEGTATAGNQLNVLESRVRVTRVERLESAVMESKGVRRASRKIGLAPTLQPRRRGESNLTTSERWS